MEFGFYPGYPGKQTVKWVSVCLSVISNSTHWISHSILYNSFTKDTDISNKFLFVVMAAL